MNASLRPKNSTEVVVDDMDLTVMTGTETYPIIGKLLTEEGAANLIRLCDGLFESANCFEKSQIVFHNRFGLFPMVNPTKIHICLGAIRVWSIDELSAYGHDFNPPHELHSWIRVEDSIVDIALPGIILRGTKFRDSKGPVLVGRTPAILAGCPPSWIQYKTAEIWE